MWGLSRCMCFAWYIIAAPWYSAPHNYIYTVFTCYIHQMHFTCAHIYTVSTACTLLYCSLESYSYHLNLQYASNTCPLCYYNADCICCMHRLTSHYPYTWCTPMHCALIWYRCYLAVHITLGSNIIYIYIIAGRCSSSFCCRCIAHIARIVFMCTHYTLLLNIWCLNGPNKAPWFYTYTVYTCCIPPNMLHPSTVIMYVSHYSHAVYTSCTSVTPQYYSFAVCIFHALHPPVS